MRATANKLHLTHFSKPSSSGKIYNGIQYGLDENGIINYEEINELLKKHNPKLLVVGASAYSREIDFIKIRKIVDRYNENRPYNVPVGENEFGICDPCLLMVDMAHIAGLVATGLHQSPIPYADVVTSTTHKTLRGPRGGIILTNSEDIYKKINRAVFPGCQGGPLMHVIAAKAVCFEEALDPSFKEYQEQVIKNIKAMEKVFKKHNIKLVSDGTDNHLLLLDLTDENISGRELESMLKEKGIVVNKNAVPNDKRSKAETSGIRIGTPAITTRGYEEACSTSLAYAIVGCIRGEDYLYNNQEQEQIIGPSLLTKLF